MLLTDGEETAFHKGYTDIDPVVKAKQLASDPDTNVRIYTVPTGQDADRVHLARFAEDTGGAMLEATDPADLPQVFFEAAVEQRGQSLVRHAASEWVESITNSPSELQIRYMHHYFEVETGASELTVLVSALRGGAPSADPNDLGWDPGDYQLIGPDDVAVAPTVVSDPYFRLLRWANPAPGTWTLRFGETLVAQPSPHPPGLVGAYVNHADLACYAGVDRQYVTPGESIEITGAAVDGKTIGQGVTFTARVLRPDDTDVVVDLEYDRVRGGYRGTLPAAELRGRGAYKVVARCKVGDDAVFERGEDLHAHDAPPNDSTTPRMFVREVSTHFFMNASEEPPLPPEDSRFYGDADGDGIADGDEPAVDTDGDGMSAVHDGDDDGDDVPDGEDPDPQDPNVPFPIDPDDDGVPSNQDVCPGDYDPEQADFDGDGIGDVCDPNSLVADAGPDQVVECIGNGVAEVLLDGSGSGAPQGALDYLWSAAVPLQGATGEVASGEFPVGTGTVTLTVSQGELNQSDSASIEVVDTIGPSIWAPADVVAASCDGISLGQPTAIDACGGPVVFTHNAPASFKAGVTLVTWRGTDQYGNLSASVVQRVTVGVGDDQSCCPIGANVIVGTSNNDVLNGTPGRDCILGKGAQDVIKGFGGDDILSGGDGDDTIEGGEGNDVLQGGTGQDKLYGQNGLDALMGMDGDDQCFGGAHDDWLSGGQGQDKLYGESGHDVLFGDDGDDRLEGGTGDDQMNGGGLHDVCLGGSGTNTFTWCEQAQ